MKNKGFTLIELMIVFAIVGIIAAIVIGTIQKNRKAKNNPLDYSNTEQEQIDTSFYKQYSIKSNQKYKIIMTDENGKKETKYFIIVEE